MQLTTTQWIKAKEVAGTSACFIWIFCCLWWVYALPHVRFFSFSTAILLVVGMFASALVFGGLLYGAKIVCFTASEKAGCNIMGVIMAVGIRLMDFLIIYPIYKTTEYLFKNFTL